MMERGRPKKLSANQITEIYKSDSVPKQLAIKHGVHLATIYRAYKKYKKYKKSA